MADNRESALLEARLSDAVDIAERRGRPHFVGFLDEREAAFAKTLMNRLRFERFLLWGGHEEAERVMFGAFPFYSEPETASFPFQPLTILYRKGDSLGHRDFLGGLLSRGVQRASIGDILVEEGRAVVFVRDEVASFLVDQTAKIGKVGVRISAGAQLPYPAAHRFEPLSLVVASARLDCLVAALAGMSREKAVACVSSGLVSLNHQEETSPSCRVEEGSKLSVRGKGKFIIDRLGPLTKKGRLCVSGRKYV